MYFSLVAIVVFVFVVVSLLFLSYFARLSHTVVATNCDFGISSLCFFLFFLMNRKFCLLNLKQVIGL